MDVRGGRGHDRLCRAIYAHLRFRNDFRGAGAGAQRLYHRAGFFSHGHAVRGDRRRRQYRARSLADLRFFDGRARRGDRHRGFADGERRLGGGISVEQKDHSQDQAQIFQGILGLLSALCIFGRVALYHAVYGKRHFHLL